MKKLTLLVALLLSTSAFATNNSEGCQGNCPTSNGGTQTQLSITEVNNRISNDVRSNAVAFAGSDSSSVSFANSRANGGEATAYGGAGGTSTSDATSSSGGNTLSNTVGGNSVVVTDSGRVRYGGEIRNVPNVSLGGLYPSASCHGTTNAGASGVGFGVSFGTSWDDPDCQIRETARSFAGLGLNNDAVAILCSSKYASTAPSCIPKEKE